MSVQISSENEMQKVAGESSCCDSKDCAEVTITNTKSSTVAAGSGSGNEHGNNTNNNDDDELPTKRKRAVVKNHNRAAIFRKWLVDTFGSPQVPPAAAEPERQATASVPEESSVSPQEEGDNNTRRNTNNYLENILDVAGGKGEISLPLSIAGYNCTVVDPRECDWSKNSIVKNLKFHLEKKNTKTYESLKERLGDRLGENGDQLPLPDKLLEFFSVFDDGKNIHETISASRPDAVPAPPASPALVKAKQECTLVVGMHADEATEPIVDFSLMHHKPFAIVPCCVFPKDNQHRKHPETGKPVKTYEDFVAYLKAKDERIKVHVLPFDGRNTVLYFVP